MKWWGRAQVLRPHRCARCALGLDCPLPAPLCSKLAVLLRVAPLADLPMSRSGVGLRSLSAWLKTGAQLAPG